MLGASGIHSPGLHPHGPSPWNALSLLVDACLSSRLRSGIISSVKSSLGPVSPRELTDVLL